MTHERLLCSSLFLEPSYSPCVHGQNRSAGYEDRADFVAIVGPDEIRRNLIRFYRANPSSSRCQDKTRSGEDCTDAIRVVGPHHIER